MQKRQLTNSSQTSQYFLPLYILCHHQSSFSLQQQHHLTPNWTLWFRLGFNRLCLVLLYQPCKCHVKRCIFTLNLLNEALISLTSNPNKCVKICNPLTALQGKWPFVQPYSQPLYIESYTCYIAAIFKNKVTEWTVQKCQSQCWKTCIHFTASNCFTLPYNTTIITIQMLLCISICLNKSCLELRTKKNIDISVLLW